LIPCHFQPRQNERCSAKLIRSERRCFGQKRLFSGVAVSKVGVSLQVLPRSAPVREGARGVPSDGQRTYVQSSIPFLELAWQGRMDWRVHMQVLALISLYAPAVIIILAVVAVLFSFFWVFLPLPRWMSYAMARLLIRFWRWRERRRR
jgi:hypothetical protein